MKFKRWQAEAEIMYQLWLDGATFEELANKYKVTKQRISQIFMKFFPERKGVHMGKGFKTIPKKLTDLQRQQMDKFIRKRQNTKKSKHGWTVEFCDIDWPTHCPILGIELDYFANFKDESPSFDRIDCKRGYERGNVLVISWRANRIKNNGTAEEHQKIADFLKKML